MTLLESEMLCRMAEIGMAETFFACKSQMDRFLHHSGVLVVSRRPGQKAMWGITHPKASLSQVLEEIDFVHHARSTEKP